MPRSYYRDPRTGVEMPIWTRNTLPLTCSGCGNRTENHRLVRPANTEPYFLSICRACERVRNAERRGSNRAPRITSGRRGAERRFGVEIECVIRGGPRGSVATAISALLPSRWRIKGDGSLGAGGCEIVSPPLRGESGLQQLKEVLALLVQRGATIDRRCGLHVHHEVQDVGRDGLIRFIRSWAANQVLIDWLVSPSRRQSRNHYCARYTDSELISLSRWDGGWSVPGSRYKAANVHSFPKFGTVEVRQHQGTLSYRKIEAWILLAQSLLDAVAGRRQALGAFATLSSMMTEIGMDEDASAFLLGRALQFGAPASALQVGEPVAA